MKKKGQIFLIAFFSCVNIFAQDWTWMQGTGAISQSGSYGTMGISSPSNNPPSRFFSTSWTDASGNFWMHGGYNVLNMFNDLWKYDPLTNEWVWINGSSSTSNQFGIYGILGISSLSNSPGSRYGSIKWTDANGDLWMFGGQGAAASSGGYLNDLWKYNVTTNMWTWINGSNVSNQTGIYGTKGVSASSNAPGGRRHGVSWVDVNGNFWMFGGTGYGKAVGLGFLNDLWKYNPLINEWTWISGSNLIDQKGIYGTIGISSPVNIPGSREISCAWESGGNLWMFGGRGYDTSTVTSSITKELNDLWKFDIISGEWTWMKGNCSVDQYSNLGIKGISSPTNKPGGREYSSAWKDVIGNFWIFGGAGYSSSASLSGYINELWRYNPVSNEWTWMKGNSVPYTVGTYGTIGVTSPTNDPGARYVSALWQTLSGDFWLFGGYGSGNNTSTYGSLSDMWRLSNQIILNVNSEDEKDIQIYPNPSNDILFVKGEKGELVNSFSLADINGRIMYENKVNTESFEIDVKGFHEGIYILRLFSNKGIKTNKITILP